MLFLGLCILGTDSFYFFSYIWWGLASLKSKSQKNKLAASGVAIEYRCLIRATDGKKTISTSVCHFIV